MDDKVLHIDGPTLVFGGPYGNLQATGAVLAEARRLGIPADRVICTGDVIAYCGDPTETIARVRDAGIHVVGGNCDEQLGQGADDCGCGFEEGSACDRLSAAWYACVDRVLGREDRAWLSRLPRRLIVEIGGRRLAVVHGTCDSINQFVFATSALGEKRRQLALAEAMGCQGIIVGHCGIPFTQVIDGRLWHNPGVVGMPANDGTARGWYSVLTPRPGGIEIGHQSFDYDYRAAMAAMQVGGYPAEYRDALATGLWPSLDVLPIYERAAQGHALDPAALVWSSGEYVPGLGRHWPAVPVAAMADAEGPMASTSLVDARAN